MPRGDTDKQYLLGQYMTPPEVAVLFFKYVRVSPADWYVLDPACGDGNLLLAAAERMLSAGLEPKEIASRICGVDVDPEMVDACRARLAERLGLDEMKFLVHVDDYMTPQQDLFSGGHPNWREFRANLILSNPPYGQNREYDFFRILAERHPAGTEMALLVPLAFMDRLIGGTVEPLDGRPLGVTTGHCLVWLTIGDPWRYRSVKYGRRNSSSFTVYSGVKLYEHGAGTPPQTDDVVRAKPYSSSAPRCDWLPCVRTGDVSPFEVGLSRLWVSWGPHLAHPKELARFQGPRLFVRRVPIWSNRQLGAAYLEEDALCAGDVLVVRHKANDPLLLKGLCVWLNSAEAAMHVLARRPSVKHRTSFPKISGKDLNMLFDHELPSESILRTLTTQYPQAKEAMK